MCDKRNIAWTLPPWDDAVAWEYDQRNAVDPDEIAWYLKYLRGNAGPKLELACGTGRLTLAIAADGHVVDGLDISPAMLARLRGKLSELPADLQSRVRLYQADMLTFTFPRLYGVIIAGYNSLQYLGTPAAIRQLVQRVWDALASPGTFLVMTYHRDPQWYEAQHTHTISKPPVVHPDHDWAVAHETVEHLDGVQALVHRHTTRRLTAADGSTISRVEETQVPLLTAADYDDLLRVAGFHVRSYSDPLETTPAGPLARNSYHVAQKA